MHVPSICCKGSCISAYKGGLNGLRMADMLYKVTNATLEAQSDESNLKP